MLLVVTVVLMLLDKLGKGIILREVISLFYIITCLVMPLVGYEFYTSSNELAALFVKVMPVTKDIYYDYTMPAISFFTLALNIPVNLKTEIDGGEILRKIIGVLKVVLTGKRNIGILLMVVGASVSLIINFLPANLRFFATLFFFSSFAGLLYVHFSPASTYKNMVIAIFILFIIFNAINSGMFTLVAYMGATVFSFFYFGIKTSMLRKSAVLLLCIFLLFMVQASKKTYLQITWKEGFTGNKAEVFTQLLIENINKGDAFFEKKSFFPFYLRANQGYNVALVMKRIPSAMPFDKGKKVFLSFSSSLVPRFLWPDKPIAGGSDNMRYYTGRNITKWSTNVGPLGEAYGSFGPIGGIVYMFFIGYFIRFAYKIILQYSLKSPALICWLPVIFFQSTYSAETDTLQIMNSIVKSLIFIWLLYKFIPDIFLIQTTRNYFMTKKPRAELA